MMELYYIIAITDRDRADTMAAIYQSSGGGLVLTKLGRGTATGEHLSVYGLDATEKAIISTFAAFNFSWASSPHSGIRS